jgi:hypothetical protein
MIAFTRAYHALCWSPSFASSTLPLLRRRIIRRSDLCPRTASPLLWTRINIRVKREHFMTALSVLVIHSDTCGGVSSRS